jgi:hypothetical protein
MHIGLGLPIADPRALLDWARRADSGPFSTLGLFDRLVCHNPEPRMTLGTARADLLPDPSMAALLAGIATGVERGGSVAAEDPKARSAFGALARSARGGGTGPY